MARPAKSVKTMSKNLTREKMVRAETEQLLRGGADKISPPKHPNARQKKKFKYIVQELEASQILGNFDIYILAQTAIAIDRLQEIEKLINKDITKLFDKGVLSQR